jgi:hypothetical protein
MRASTARKHAVALIVSWKTALAVRHFRVKHGRKHQHICLSLARRMYATARFLL